MRRLLFVFCLLAVQIVSFSQTSDAQLTQRLDDYLRLNRELKFKELMEYIHPSLFTMAPKDQLIQMFENSFDNPTMKLSIDSTRILTISPTFLNDKGQFKKVDYSMQIGIQFKDTASFAAPGFVEKITTAFQNAYEGATVSFNKNTHHFIVKASSILMAIKDDTSAPWLFLGYQKNQPMLKTLFPEKVVEHFKL